ncbi:hypothetical protein BJV74DRAFT_826774, partial [Russula compacta]
MAPQTTWRSRARWRFSRLTQPHALDQFLICPKEGPRVPLLLPAKVPMNRMQLPAFASV